MPSLPAPAMSARNVSMDPRRAKRNYARMTSRSDLDNVGKRETQSVRGSDPSIGIKSNRDIADLDRHSNSSYKNRSILSQAALSSIFNKNLSNKSQASQSAVRINSEFNINDDGIEEK